MATGRRRGRAFIYIALILILLLVLVFAVTRFGGTNIIAGNEPEQEPVVELLPTPVPVDVVDIVVTTQDVRRGQDLTENLIQVVAIPREDYTEGVFFNSLDEVLGARAKMDLKAHTPLTNGLIIAKTESGSMPSFEIPKGMVAISVPISKLSSVSYGLQKGDHVNVIVSLLLVDLDTTTQTRLPNRTGYIIAAGPMDEQTSVTAQFYGPPEYTVSSPSAASFLGRIEIEPTLNNPVFVLPSEPQRPRLVSQSLIQDVVILQIGYFDLAKDEPIAAVPAVPTAEQPQTQQQGQQPAQPQVNTPVPPDVVTLIVTPQDAVTINYLMLVGADLNLVMRSAGDDSKFDTEAVTLQFILDQYRIPNPAKLPYGLEPRFDRYPSSVSPFPDPAPRTASEQ
jgi:Flp pilus assembly protein CpaB